MSKFSKVRSKLSIAFSGAAKNIVDRKNLIADGVIAGATTGACAAFGLVAGLALLPYAAYCVGVCVAFDGAAGAYSALKTDALVSKVRAGKVPRGYKETEGSTDTLKTYEKKGLLGTKKLIVAI